MTFLKTEKITLISIIRITHTIKTTLNCKNSLFETVEANCCIQITKQIFLLRLVNKFVTSKINQNDVYRMSSL